MKNIPGPQKIILLELRRQNMTMEDGEKDSPLNLAVDKIYSVSQERSLKVTPAYVQKLLESVISS